MANHLHPSVKSTSGAIIVLSVVTALVFGLDLLTPLGINDGYFYAISILVTLWIPGKTSTFIMEMVAVVLIVIAFYVGLNREGPVVYSVTNRLFAIVGIFITAYAVLKNKDKEWLMERQNVELKQNLDKLNRSNAELEEYAHIASHDLQEPLRRITSYISLLQKRIGDNADKEMSYFFTVIVDSAQKMRALINSFLTFSQIGKDRHFKDVDTAKLIEDVKMTLSAQIQECKADIQVDGLPVIKAVESEVRQVFQDLIINAIKFKRKDVLPVVKIRFEDKPGEWQFSVADNGIGISEEYFDKLFVIFEKLHVEGEFPGLGIGLATCKKIIEINDGKIWVDSEPNVGSTFYFTISKSQASNS